MQGGQKNLFDGKLYSLG